MARTARENKSDFDILLNWLDSDRELAALKYEDIRSRLTRVFLARGCYTADELADETIERVTKRIRELHKTYKGEPARFFYGVAKNVFLEYARKPKGQELPARLIYSEDNSEEAERRDQCLRDCLAKIPQKQSSFIVQYYKRDGQEKIKYRKRMAKELGISEKALRVRAYRVRNTLQSCVRTCVEGE